MPSPSTSRYRPSGRCRSSTLPGVAQVSRGIAGDGTLAAQYMWANRLVAVLSGGSAVLEPGDVSHAASLPAMEGKCALAYANILPAEGVSDITVIVSKGLVRSLSPRYSAVRSTRGACRITQSMKVAAAYAIDSMIVEELRPDYIVPSPREGSVTVARDSFRRFLTLLPRCDEGRWSCPLS